MTKKRFTDNNEAIQFIFDQLGDLAIKYEALKGYTALLAREASKASGFDLGEFNRLIAEMAKRTEGTHTTEEQAKQLAEMRAIAVYLSTGEMAEIIQFPGGATPDRSGQE